VKYAFKGTIVGTYIAEDVQGYYSFEAKLIDALRFDSIENAITWLQKRYERSGRDFTPGPLTIVGVEEVLPPTYKEVSL